MRDVQHHVQKSNYGSPACQTNSPTARVVRMLLLQGRRARTLVLQSAHWPSSFQGRYQCRGELWETGAGSSSCSCSRDVILCMPFTVNSPEADAPGKGVWELLERFPDGRTRCLDCNSTFKSNKTGKQHVETTHMPQYHYQCLICKAVIRGKLYFIQHVGRKHFRGGEKIAQNYGRVVAGP